MEVDRNGFEVLDRAECLRLLAEQTLGRVAFTSRALPTVLPVHFWLEGERILLRTRRGGQLDAALHDAVVAFEADDVAADSQSGWSVAATGRATHVDDPCPDELGDRPLNRWPTRHGASLIAISTELLTGRRLTALSAGTRADR